MGIFVSRVPEKTSMPLKPSREFGGGAMVDGTLMAQTDNLIPRRFWTRGAAFDRNLCAWLCLKMQFY
jgi:hypothetical protein